MKTTITVIGLGIVMAFGVGILFVAADHESDPADLVPAGVPDVTTGLNKSAEVLRRQSVQRPAAQAVEKHPLPDGLKITVVSDDPELKLKQRIGSEICEAKIIPEARREFFKRYQEYGRELDYFQASIVKVEETPTGWKADIEVKLVEKKGERGIYSNTLIESYESVGVGVSFVGSRHGDLYLDLRDLD